MGIHNVLNLTLFISLICPDHDFASVIRPESRSISALKLGFQFGFRPTTSVAFFLEYLPEANSQRVFRFARFFCQVLGCAQAFIHQNQMRKNLKTDQCTKTMTSSWFSQRKARYFIHLGNPQGIAARGNRPDQTMLLFLTQSVISTT